MIHREVALLGAPDAAIGQPQAKTKGVQAMQLNLTSDVIEELLGCIKSGKTPQILLGNNPVRFSKLFSFSRGPFTLP
jgi:RNA polymerase II elongation factor ELL